MQDCLVSIEEALRENSPIDGVLGFSQGAAMLALVCALQQQRKITNTFKFAIVVAGFKSKSIQHKEYYDNVIDLPSLHVYGETDEVNKNANI